MNLISDNEISYEWGMPFVPVGHFDEARKDRLKDAKTPNINRYFLSLGVLEASLVNKKGRDFGSRPF
jgi:hypothetical protein